METNLLNRWASDKTALYGFGQCLICINYYGDKICPAFENGIPADIFDNIIQHNIALPEQKNNIVFEPLKQD